MATKSKMPAWGARFRAALDEKEVSLADVAEAMELAESTLRSWTNGSREPNVSEFLRLCEAAKLSPAEILFGSKLTGKPGSLVLKIAAVWPELSNDSRQRLAHYAEALYADDRRAATRTPARAMLNETNR